MAKSGQARVLTPDQKNHLFNVIDAHRHPEKNRAIMQISFKLGLRAQEIALLQIKEIANVKPSSGNNPALFTLYDVMALPAAYTKGANAVTGSLSSYKQRTVSFSIYDFDRVIRDVERQTKAGLAVDPKRFYPEIKTHRGVARDLPMVDSDLRESLETYLEVRLENDLSASPSSPLFVSQKGSSYSPNTLQEHMSLMLRGWAGIEKASSHSGRRGVATSIIHTQKGSVKTAQKILGHKNPSTTILYEEPPETALAEALKNITSQ